MEGLKYEIKNSKSKEDQNCRLSKIFLKKYKKTNKNIYKIF